MQVRPIPPNVLNAVASLLQPFAADASPTTLVEALRQHGKLLGVTDRQLLSPRDFGKLAGVSGHTIKRLAIAGRLPAVKIGVQWRIPATALDEMLAGPVAGEA